MPTRRECCSPSKKGTRRSMCVLNTPLSSSPCSPRSWCRPPQQLCAQAWAPTTCPQVPKCLTTATAQPSSSPSHSPRPEDHKRTQHPKCQQLLAACSFNLKQITAFPGNITTVPIFTYSTFLSFQKGPRQLLWSGSSTEYGWGNESQCCEWV